MEVFARPMAVAAVLVLGSMAVASPVWGGPDVVSVPALPLAMPSGAASFPTGEPNIRVQVTAPNATVLSSEISGHLQELTVRDGDRFEKNQILVRFECSAQENQLARARAVLEKRTRVLEVNERLRRLGSISGKEIAVGTAEVNEARAEVGVMEALVRRCTIRAPFTGRVTAMTAHVHQFIGEGQPLFDIVDDQALELEAIVPSRWLSWLQPGQTFEVKIDENGRRYPATVDRLSGRVDPVSQSVKIYARIGGSENLLLGMSGQALFSPSETGPSETGPSETGP